MREKIYKNVNKKIRSYFRILSIFIFMIGSFSTSFSSNILMNDSCNLSLVSVDNVVCFGASDGIITVHADSGSGLYHYYIEIYHSSFGWQSVGQVPAPGQYTAIDTVSFINLPADTFRVILEDSANQCFDTTGFPIINLLISEPTQIIISENVTNATNIFSSDGSISLSASGGGPAYAFSWTGPNGFLSSSQNINNLQYGIYNYTLTDTNGCIITDSVYVAASQACSFGSFTSVPPICFGDGNGQILINSVFGSPQFTYLLEYQDPNTMNWNYVTSITVADSFYTFINLYSGIYQYTLTDSSGCSVTAPQVNVQDPTSISSNNTIIFTSSSTSCDGQLSSIINGGVAPITHNWIGPNSFSSNLQIIINLCVGTYCDSVVDANGCNAILCDFVDFEPACSPEVEINNIFCDEDSSGLAIVTKTNNAYPLFVWINDFTGDTISMDTFAVNLAAGDYTFNAYNLGVPGACPDTSIPFSIITPEVNILSLNGDVICVGDSTSFTFETINTDTSFIYQVLISNDVLFDDDTSSFYPSGSYSYTVETDTGNGFISCLINQNIEIINNDLNIDSILIINEICATSLASIEVFVSSSFSPINFSLDTNYQFSNLFTNLSSSFYSLSVMDAMNCSVSKDSILVDLESIIVLNVDSSLETCRLNDGWIKVIFQNGYGGYQYSIDSGLSFSSTIYSDTILIDSLVKGYYNLVVRDDSMCVYDYGNIYIDKTPRPKIDYIHMKNESCCGWDGEITISSTPQNSISIYSLDTFNTFQNSNIFDSLLRGDYLIYIEDTNACLDSIEVTLEADSTPNINLTVGITDVVCNGDSNGTFKVYYPNDCYIYELHRYTFFTPTLVLDTGDYFNELISGFYGVRAISNSGTCFDSSSVKFIDEPIPIFFDPAVITDVRCLNNDSCNGEVYLHNEPTGGVSPYYYYLKDVNNNIPIGILPSSQKFEYLCPSEYEIQVVDGNACVVYDTIFIADSSLYVDSFSIQNVQCYNGNDGVVEVFVSGGLGNYSYLWSNSDTTNIADSLSGDEYFILVTDSVGCFAFDSVQISDPDTLQFDILGKKDETCMGVTNDGEIYLAFYGGTPPYNFMWSSFSGFSGNSGFGFGDTIFNLTYDTIIIDVTDANYCSASPVWVTQSVTIVDALNSSNPLSFDSIYLSENRICFGAHTAFIDIDLNGGDAPIQYSIDSMNSWSALDSFAHLNAGKYNIYVQDAYGCLDSTIVNITEYEEIIIYYDSIKHVSCFEGNDGYISVSNSGGVSPYSFLWIPTSETNNQISDLYAVPHIIKVTDSVNCVVIDTIDLYELTEPIQTISSVVNIVSCFEGNDGDLSTSTIGGMPNYNYVWINENSDTVSTNEIATGLSAGNYLVFVSDSFNCGPSSDSITLSSNPEIEIDILNIINNICFEDILGEFTLDVTGGIPNYFISLLDENNNITTSYNTTISDLASSDYMVWVTDVIGCVSDTTFNVKLASPGRSQIHNNIENVSCYKLEDGVMNLSFLSGTPPYNYIVEYDNIIIGQSQVNQSIMFSLEELSEGEYYISVTDFNSCFVDSVFYVSEPDEIISDFIPLSDFGRESFSFEAENTSVGGQIYYWDFDNDSTKTSSYLQEIKMQFTNQGEYNVMMVAHDTILGHQCNDTIIKVIDVEGYDVYNVFTPNNDGINDVFHFNEWMLNRIYVEIFNRWGQKIYHWDNVNSGWEGRAYNGRNVEEGVYFYRLEATGEDGAHFKENGSITLIR